ncbi:hypothetical protein JMJ35_004938 [Cladonia borealis]|uniref:Uncharacterized protein n=1 Tax=Cladonia borealis TaxID=184061 RepID=A0AA39UB00_9LECA|nr:hypothetical protein JMJ35_004938 [Cladonia borealis]
MSATVGAVNRKTDSVLAGGSRRIDLILACIQLLRLWPQVEDPVLMNNLRSLAHRLQPQANQLRTNSWDAPNCDNGQLELLIWAELDHVDFNGVKACSVAGGKGIGLSSTTSTSMVSKRAVAGGEGLLRHRGTFIEDLVLSFETVWIYAKPDQHLLQVLEAVGDYSKTARGAILIFLLLQLTNPRTHGKIGVLNPFYAPEATFAASQAHKQDATSGKPIQYYKG